MFSFFAPDFVLDVRIFVQVHPDLKHVLWSRLADRNQILRDESFITSWRGGGLHFHVMYKIVYDPPPPIPLEKKSRPP